MYQHCLSLGLQPFYADSEARLVSSEDANSQYNLLPKEQCQKANKKPLFVMLGSASLTLILLIILMLMPVSRATDQLNELKQHTRQVEKVALEIEDSKKSIDYLFQATQALIDKKKAAASVIELMNTVTEVFGDDTWVSNWRYFNKTLQLTGQSGSASNLIASLEKTRLFKNTKFISPVTKDRRSGLERFKISTEVIIEQNADAE
jgi:general secretion pathway protein L